MSRAFDGNADMLFWFAMDEVSAASSSLSPLPRYFVQGCSLRGGKHYNPSCGIPLMEQMARHCGRTGISGVVVGTSPMLAAVQRMCVFLSSRYF